MKKYIKQVVFLVVALVLMTASIYEIKENSEETMKYMPVTNKVIILDAGHAEKVGGKRNEKENIHFRER